MFVGLSEALEHVAVYLPFLPTLVCACVFTEHRLTPRCTPLVRVCQVLAALYLVLPIGDLATIVTSLVAGLLMPLLLYEGADVIDRMLLAALTLTGATAGEVVGYAAWSLLTDGALTASVASSIEHYASHIVSSLACAAVCALVLWIFSTQLDEVHERFGKGRLPLVTFLLVQSTALYLISKWPVITGYTVPTVFWGSAVLVLVSLVADFEVFRAAGRLRVREEEARRVESLACDLEDLAGRTRAEMRALSEVAMLRHDMRNHLIVLRELVSSGNRTQAAEYARAVAKECARGGREGGERP